MEVDGEDNVAIDGLDNHHGTLIWSSMDVV
jgi:hypothetical protein